MVFLHHYSKIAKGRKTLAKFDLQLRIAPDSEHKGEENLMANLEHQLDKHGCVDNSFSICHRDCRTCLSPHEISLN
jgi:hypothetical protein